MPMLRARYWQLPAPSNVVNGVLFNVSWLAIVLTQSSMVAVAVVVLHLVIHLRLMAKGRGELLLIAVVTLCGAIIDQVLFHAGIFTLSGQSALAPLWLTCLWPVFATTLLHSFAALRTRVLLAVVLGAAAGALSYSAGVRLTAVEFGSPGWGPVILGAVWAILFPLLLALSTRLGNAGEAAPAWSAAERRAFD